MTRDLQSVLEEADGRWQRHLDLLDAARDQRIRGPEDPFTAAQELGHHAHWIEYALAATRARAEGTPRPQRIEDEDAQNGAWAEQDAALSYAQAREWATAAHHAYGEYVGSLPPEHRTERIVDGVADLLIDHVDDHFSYLVLGELAHESVEWERITALLDACPQGVLHTGDDGAEWDAPKIYAHLERWMTVNVPRVEAFLAQGAVPDLPASVDDLNGRWLAEDRAVPFADARRRAFLARDRFRATVRAVPAGRWTSRLAGLFHGNARGHYLEHLGYIEEAGGLRPRREGDCDCRGKHPRRWSGVALRLMLER